MVRPSRLQIAVAIVGMLAMTLAAEHSKAQRPPTAPFQVGAAYHLTFLGASGDIRVLAPPDPNGMVAAIVLGGFDGSFTGQQVWVNVRLALLVQAVDAQTVGGSARAGAAAPAPGNAYAAQVRSDLRNLVTAEEAFFADNVRYANELRGLAYSPSAGVTVTIVAATGTGWAATATHISLPGYVCGIFVGSAPAPVAGQNEGEPACVRR